VEYVDDDDGDLSYAIISRQLGYAPENFIRVGASTDVATAKCMETTTFTRYPLVSILYPLNHNDLGGRYSDGYMKPFPTILWMTCPYLHTRVSRLEDAGWVEKLRQRLVGESNSEDSSDGKENQIDYVVQMEGAHKQYAEFRWSLLTPEDQEAIRDSDYYKAFADVGIAGMKNFRGVKCLHCHYAHYLCFPEHGNVIGEWVHELLQTVPAVGDPGDVIQKSRKDGCSMERKLDLSRIDELRLWRGRHPIAMSGSATRGQAEAPTEANGGGVDEGEDYALRGLYEP
jgi:hypothetical protein